jgi:PAS domain S-box-containing protein
MRGIPDASFRAWYHFQHVAGALMEASMVDHADHTLQVSDPGGLRLAFEGMPVPVAVCTADRQQRVLSFNRKFRDTFGYDVEQVATVEAWAELVYPDPDYRRAVLEWWNEAVNQVLSQGGGIPGREVRVRRADGELRDVVIGADLVAAQLVVTLLDVTDTRRVEALQQRTQTGFERLVKELPVPLFWLDASGRTLLVNRAFTETFGYSFEDIPDAWTWWTCACPEPQQRRATVDAWRAMFVDAPVGQRAGPLELQLSDRSGGVHEVEMSGITFEDGAFLGVVVDITARLETEAALRSARQELERTAYEVTENMPVGAYTMVMLPEESAARFSFMSRRFLELLGLTREQAESDPFYPFQAVHPDDREAWVALNLDTFKRRVPFAAQTRLLVHGQVRWCSAESVPRHLPGGGIVWEGALIDITAQKQAEFALQEAHAERLQAGVERTRLQERERLLQDMHDGFGWQLATARLRVQRGDLSLEGVERVLVDCIDELQLLADSTSGDTGNFENALANMRYRMAGRLPPGVRINWSVSESACRFAERVGTLQIMRIIQEATGNALKHAASDLIEVGLRIEAIHTGDTQQSDALVLSVRDHGAGLPEELPAGGRGLGNMARRARSLGGSLEFVRRAPGTEVLVQIPISPAESPS